MLPCHSRYVYGTWRSKNVGGSNKDGGSNFHGLASLPELYRLISGSLSFIASHGLSCYVF